MTFKILGKLNGQSVNTAAPIVSCSDCPVPPHSASPGVNDFYLWRKTLLSCVVLRLPFYTEVLLVRTFLNDGATSFFFSFPAASRIRLL